MVEVDRHGGVAVLTMTRPKVNALSGAMVRAISEGLSEVCGDASVGAVVLASGMERAFSAGFDLKELDELASEPFEGFIESFAALYRQIATAPVPVVAAVGGHALAGGAILALACDRRVFAEGQWGFGLTEVDLGVPLPPGVVHLIRTVGGERVALEACVFGRRYTPAEARQVGLADRLVAPEALPEAAGAEAAELAAKPRGALAAIREQFRVPLGRELARLDAGVGGSFRRWWFDPVAVERRRQVLAGRS
ncbi:MAG: enoyl-CoA hydratase/isomerase family protein [Deferrisomatales bacterium]